MIPHKQLNLADIFEDCKNIFEEDKPQFLSLLEEHINLSDYIPLEFYNHFYASTGRSRKYSLTSLLWAVILQKIFSIPTDQLLLVFLHYSQHLRDFCGFKKVPDASKITRFKQDFENDIENVFHNLVDITEPICKAIDSEKADTFLGDAAFDSISIYKYLLEDTGFKRAYIPLKNKLSIPDTDYKTDANGIPCCPNDPSLPMKREGSKSHLRCGVPTMKFVCPKMKWVWDKERKRSYRKCECENPCTTSSCGRMIYVYPEQNLRAYPGTTRGNEEWDATYKIRVNVEKSINHIKDSFCIAGRRTQNEKTLHADLLLAGITQLVTVMVADKIHQHQYLRSLKPLIA